MDATPYLYGGHYGFALWHSPRPYDYDTTKIDDECEEYQQRHGTSIKKFIIINELQEGDILFVGSEETVEEQEDGQSGFGFVVKNSRGALSFEYSEEVCEWKIYGGCGIRNIIQEGRERFGKYVNYKEALRELIEFCSVGAGRNDHCGIKWDDIPEGWCEHSECEEHKECILPWIDTKGILGPPGQKFKRHRNYLFFGEQDPYHWIGELSRGEPHNIRTPLAKDPELQEMLGYQGQYIIDSEGKPTEEWVPLLEEYTNIPVMRRVWCDPDSD